MIKKIIKFATVSLAVSAIYIGTSNAKSTSMLDNVYLKAGVGAMKFNKFKETGGYSKRKAPKVGPAYNIGIGYRFNESIRTDLNLQYSELKYKDTVDKLKQNVKTMAAFINGYYDINFHESIVPYITAGIGVGRNDAGDLKELAVTKDRKGKTTTNFIWNIGAGAQYRINKNFAADLGYRYMDLGKTKTDTYKVGTLKYEGGKQNIRCHQVIGSLIYNF